MNGRVQSESIPEGLTFVIQSPLTPACRNAALRRAGTIGSKKKISLPVLCASAVNVVLRGTITNPKPQ
jgi:hypothetical protein